MKKHPSLPTHMVHDSVLETIYSFLKPGSLAHIGPKTYSELSPKVPIFSSIFSKFPATKNLMFLFRKQHHFSPQLIEEPSAFVMHNTHSFSATSVFPKSLVCNTKARARCWESSLPESSLAGSLFPET